MQSESIKTICEPELLSAVQDQLQKDTHAPFINELLSKELKGYDVYLWGGAVRDPLVNQFYCQNIKTTDFDLLVDNSQKPFPLPELLEGLEGLVVNQFGSPKWKPSPNIEIDIVPFSNAMMIRNKESEENSLATMLKSCEFNTGAIAYPLASPAIYSYGALEAIKEQEIEIAYIKGISLAMLMSKLVLQSEKLGFTIGQKAKELIASKYSPELNPRIKSYLQYKEVPKSYELVVKKLQSIKASTPKPDGLLHF